MVAPTNLQALQRARHLDGVLATLVDVEGNAYRRPGAKALFDADGEGVGSITAGCLEDDLRAVSEQVRGRDRPELVTYDLTTDDDVWGLGIGCDGVVDVLLEPTGGYGPAVASVEEGQDVAVLTVLEGAGPLAFGDRAFYRPGEGRLVMLDGGPAEDWPADALAGPAAELAGRDRAGVVEVDFGEERLAVFVDGLAAPPELVVFGTGPDVDPVVEFGTKTGFRATVVGFRGGVDLAERFSAAHRTVTTSPAAVGEALDLDERTYAVVMSHNFVDDQLTVDELLRTDVPYVGLLGPRERFEEMCEAFAAEGRTLSAAERSRVYTPVGLDLGGESPYQIAHGIVAEVLAVHNGRDPDHLSAREGPIHERVDVSPGEPPER